MARVPSVGAALRAPIRASVFWGGLALAVDKTVEWSLWVYDNWRLAGIIAACVFVAGGLLPPLGLALGIGLFVTQTLIHSSPYLIIALLAVAGGILGWEHQDSSTPISPYRVWSATAAALVALGLMLAVGFPLIAVAGLAAAAVVLLVQKRAPAAVAVPADALEGRGVHDRIVAALRYAKVPGLPDEPIVLMPGHAAKDEYGTGRLFSVNGVCGNAVAGKVAELAVFFNVAEEQIRVTGPTGTQSARTFHIWLGNGHPPEPGRHWLVTAGRQDFTQPVKCSMDARGEWLHLLTLNTHTGAFGKTRSGKTQVLRAGLLSPALLDPTVEVGIITGKVNPNDWRPAKDLCNLGYVEGASSADIDAIERFLVNLTRVNEQRGDTEATDLRPMLVVVDEWYSIRQAAALFDKDQAKRIDGLMASLGSTASGRRIHLAFCGQRATVEYLPGDLKANIGQRIQGVAAKRAEIGYAIDADVAVLPRKAGEFLISDDDGGSAVLSRAPEFTHDDFRALVKRATAIREEYDEEQCATLAPTLMAPPLTEAVEDGESTSDSTEDPDPPATWQDCVRVLLEESDEPMTTTELHRALVDHGITPPSRHANHFGRDLTRDSKSERPTVTATHRDKNPAWTLATPVVLSVREHFDPHARSDDHDPTAPSVPSAASGRAA